MTTRQTTEQWRQKLKLFLDQLLTPIIPNPAQRAKYFTPEAMKIWERAFTHETVSPSDNYEDLEFGGDANLKYVFPKYVRRRLPHLHKGEYTELNIYYMSKIRQAELARKLGFTEYIQVKGIDRAILNLETDVFESFFGALDEVSDMITDGLGASNCFNMIVHIFKDIEIDESKGRGSPKTQVIQIFVRFDLPKPIETPDEIDKFHVTFTVSLAPEHIAFLRDYSVNIPNAAIGYAQAPTKKEAEAEAYQQALDTLAGYGITTQWAEEEKQQRDFTDPAVAPFVEAATQRLAREGYVSMYFFIPRKTVTPRGAVVQLIGVRPDGQDAALTYTYATERENSYRTAKAQVVRQYATGR
jgi:dsRNA-specific ribonuclease